MLWGDDGCAEYSAFVALEACAYQGDESGEATEARTGAVHGDESFACFDESDESVQLLFGDEAVVCVQHDGIEAGEVLFVERIDFG